MRIGHCNMLTLKSTLENYPELLCSDMGFPCQLMSEYSGETTDAIFLPEYVLHFVSDKTTLETFKLESYHDVGKFLCPKG